MKLENANKVQINIDPKLLMKKTANKDHNYVKK